MPSNSEFYDRIAVDYDSLRYGRPYHRRTADMELEYLDGLLPAGRYLEVGPGTGRVTEFLLKKADSLQAVDISAQMLEQLRTRLGEPATLQTAVMDIERLPSLPGYGTFDVCVSMRVVPHLPELVRALSLLRGSVAPGGRVVFDLWNAWGYDGLGKRLKVRPSRVYTRYDSIPQMRRAIAQAGLRVLSTRGFGYPPFSPFLALDRGNPPVVSFFAQRVIWVCEPAPTGS